MQWSFQAEYIACIIILILSFYSKERISHMERQNKLFYDCLRAAFYSTVLNIVTIWIMKSSLAVPLWALYLLNTLYFISVAGVEFLMLRYYLLLIHKNSVDKSCLFRANRVSAIFFAVYTVVALTNFRTGIIFALGADGNYVRGPGNRLIYLLFLICLMMIVVCFIRQRRFVDQSMRKVMRIAPLFALFLATFQGIRPDVIMTGTVMAVSLLILFISFQSQEVHTDDLTGLCTREVFYRRLELLAQEKLPFRAVIISVRQFKTVNEKYGTRVGDAFLRQIADYIERISGEAVVCRYEGVRFGVIFQGISEEVFARYLKHIRDRFEYIWSHENYRCLLPVNIAYIDRFFELEDVGELSACLDYAVSISKSRGTGCCVYFSPEMYQAFKRQNRLVEMIKQGMETEQFYLNFQPVYNCAGMVFDSCEILLRLKDEEGNNVSPAEFIPMAEKRGLIVDLSWMIIEMACRFINSNPEYKGTVSINFSVQQFLEADMVERMISLTERYQVGPGRIKIEITERIVAEDTDRVLSIMNQLNSRGFGFYLDDFGTGYSSLSYVLTLPFESIKLDKSLVDGVQQDKNRILVESIVNCFHTIGVETITEGVETEAQDRIIKELGTDKIQGYYYSRPLSEEDFMELIRRQEKRCTR